MGIQTITDFAGSRRGKWVTLLVWVLLAGAIIPAAPMLSDVRSGSGSLFLPEDSESARAIDLANERYPNSGTPAIIVIRNEAGLTDADFNAAREINDFIVSGAAGDNVNGVVSIFTIPQAESELISPDNTTMTIVASVTGDTDEDPFRDTIKRIREVTAEHEGAELAVKVSGPGGLIVDLSEVFAGIDGFLLAITASLVLVLLVLIYRSPVVALVPLISVGWVFMLASAFGALLAEGVGFAVDPMSTGIMTVMLFGAGTDYCLFISSRYREELTKVEDKHEAMRRTMRGVGGAVLSAGGTILIATVILLLAVLPAYRSLGPVLAIAVIVMLVASLTLVPAILTILGRASFWPFRPAYTPDQPVQATESRGWSWIADHVLRRPVTMLVAMALAMIVLSAGILEMDLTYDSLETLPSDTEAVEGFELLREGFPAGELAPTDVYVVLPDGQGVFEPASLEVIDAVALSLTGQDSVVSIFGPSRPFGAEAPVGPAEMTAALESIPPDVRDQILQGEGGPPGGAQSNPDSPEAQAIGMIATAGRFVSADGSVARIEVVLDENPYGPEAMDLVPDLRDAARAAAETGGLGRDQVLVGGATAESFDQRAGNIRDTIIVLPLILLAIGIILGVLLRSVIAPVYLCATIIVTYFGTLGLSVLCFKYIFGHDVVGSSVPFYLFVFLNALGVDYNIYLMARIREEAKEHELAEATRRAVVRTGGVITSAGLILAGTFSALMTLPLQDLFQLGFAVAIGVLIDTFITRTLIVPSIVVLLGRWNWWPSRSVRQPVPARQPAPADG